jgi:hypothetical protein
MKNSKLQNSIDRADPRQESFFGADHTEEILKNMQRPSKEIRDQIAETEERLNELYVELEIADKLAHEQDPYEPQ